MKARGGNALSGARSGGDAVAMRLAICPAHHAPPPRVHTSPSNAKSPSPAPSREREGPIAQRWEGEGTSQLRGNGRCIGKKAQRSSTTSTIPSPLPLPRKDAGEGMDWPVGCVNPIARAGQGFGAASTCGIAGRSYRIHTFQSSASSPLPRPFAGEGGTRAAKPRGRVRGCLRRAQYSLQTEDCTTTGTIPSPPTLRVGPLPLPRAGEMLWGGRWGRAPLMSTKPSMEYEPCRE